MIKAPLTPREEPADEQPNPRRRKSRAKKIRMRPGQEELWARLCDEANAFVLAYWTRFEAEGWGEQSNWQRWVEEADSILWRGSGGSRTSRPALIVTWWATRVGAHQARQAIKLWQQEVLDA